MSAVLSRPPKPKRRAVAVAAVATAAPQPAQAVSAARARLDRWRALLGLIWAAGKGKAVFFAVVLLLVGLLPTALMLVTGALVQAIPAAVAGGLGSPAGQPAVLALSALVTGLAVLTLATNALTYVSGALDSACTQTVQKTIAAVTLGTPGVAELEDPVFADELQAVQDAQRRGVLRRTTQGLTGVAIARLRGAGAFVVLLGFSWWAPLVLAAAWWLTNRVYVKSTETGISVQMNDGAAKLRRAEYLRSLAVESSAAKEVRVFGLSPWIVGRYGDTWLEAVSAMWQSRRSNRALTAATAVALVVSHAVVLAALAAAAVNGDVGGAALLVFVQAVLATTDLGLIGEVQYYLAESLAVSGHVTRILRRAAGTPLPEPSPASAKRGGETRKGAVAVRLDDVRFTYRARVEPTLDGLDLEVPAGQSLAIVGENGAGKSTLIKLLCGLYQPEAGRVTLDGVPPLQARGRVGVIFQDFVRYKLPLRENVGFGNLGRIGDTAELEGALRDAGGAGILASLPDGWDTVLSREFAGGTDLSGGQWQRIALARALAAIRGGAGLLILDEPTAALDVRAETELFERFLELTRGVTTILVSHRLSSVRRADRIVVVDGGRVVEDGSHDELMRLGGRYAEMFTLQAARFAEPQPEEEEAAHA